MGTPLPPWHYDADHPRYDATSLEARNIFLYGVFRTAPMWAANVEPPVEWTFSAEDIKLDYDLRLMWTLIAETHFIHVLMSLLPDDDQLVQEIRSYVDEYTVETTRVVEGILAKLRRFAERFPAAEIQLQHFEVDWSTVWKVRIEPAT